MSCLAPRTALSCPKHESEWLVVVPSDVAEAWVVVMTDMADSVLDGGQFTSSSPT
jgi:hypothetical protein